MTSASVLRSRERTSARSMPTEVGLQGLENTTARAPVSRIFAAISAPDTAASGPFSSTAQSASYSAA